eukprot:3579670-Rhodomonas_salina.2
MSVPESHSSVGGYNTLYSSPFLNNVLHTHQTGPPYAMLVPDITHDARRQMAHLTRLHIRRIHRFVVLAVAPNAMLVPTIA